MAVMYGGSKPVIFIPLLSETFFSPVFILTNFVQRSDSGWGELQQEVCKLRPLWRTARHSVFQRKKSRRL